MNFIYLIYCRFHLCYHFMLKFIHFTDVITHICNYLHVDDITALYEACHSSIPLTIIKIINNKFVFINPVLSVDPCFRCPHLSYLEYKQTFHQYSECISCTRRLCQFHQYVCTRCSQSMCGYHTRNITFKKPNCSIQLIHCKFCRPICVSCHKTRRTFHVINNQNYCIDCHNATV